MARSFGVRPSRYSGGDRLDAATYDALERDLLTVGIDWSPGADGRETLAALRSTYEPLLDGLANYLLLELPGWRPEDGASDNWEQGPRGLIARRLVEELSGRRGAAVPALPDAPSLPVGDPDLAGWRGLRRRLKPQGGRS